MSLAIQSIRHALHLTCMFRNEALDQKFAFIGQFVRHIVFPMKLITL